MLLSSVGYGQSMVSSELLHELHKLNTVGSVLFVAAHPDDENTALLTYLAEEEKLDTAYLALTRGGGGQNLIGPELKEGLGLIRANELLRAREIDGAKQLFTRARDFGYFKNPEDTLENWQEEKVLGDVVYAVRYFKPDVIITRFNPAAGRTHGHHTVSAQLALKAFKLAADPSQFPEQLSHLESHQAKRIFWNGYGRRGGDGLSDERREIVELEVGRYNPYLGTSYTEIAARSRSMHKSQGFGRSGRRGERTERLVLLGGEPADGNFMKGVDTTWARYSGGEKVERLLTKAIRVFDYAAPWKVVPSLIEADAILESLSATRQTRSKRETLHRSIAAAMGMHFEARASSSYLSPGEEASIQVELVNRSPVSARVGSVEASLFDSENWPERIPLKCIENLDKRLDANISETVEFVFKLPEDSPLTQPYWLKTKPSSGRYHFENPRLLELEAVPAPIEVIAKIEVAGRMIQLATPAIERTSDPVKGEIHKIVAIRPKVVLKPNTSVLLFENARSKQIEVKVTGHSGDIRGTLVAEAPMGWRIEIGNPEFALTDREPVRVMSLTVVPPEEPSEGSVWFKVVDSDGKSFDVSSNLIEYEHIGRQPILEKARTKLTRLELARAGNRIACFQGVGDPIPETLERIGYRVDRISVEEIDRARLENYDTVILGPRVFDAYAGLDKRFDELTAYVDAGGTLISQYNTTSSRTKSKFTSPYPLRLSRDRVSEEKAEMRILQPEHPVFNVPKKSPQATSRIGYKNVDCITRLLGTTATPPCFRLTTEESLLETEACSSRSMARAGTRIRACPSLGSFPKEMPELYDSL